MESILQYFRPSFKLPIVIKIFVLSILRVAFYKGFTVNVQSLIRSLTFLSEPFLLLYFWYAAVNTLSKLRRCVGSSEP